MQLPIQLVLNLASVTLPNDYVLNGSYIIRRTLGQGGFGITYLAEEVVTGRSVVIKENFPVSCSMRCPDSYMVEPVSAMLQSGYDWTLNSFLNDARLACRPCLGRTYTIAVGGKAVGQKVLVGHKAQKLHFVEYGHALDFGEEEAPQLSMSRQQAQQFRAQLHGSLGNRMATYRVVMLILSDEIVEI